MATAKSTVKAQRKAPASSRASVRLAIAAADARLSASKVKVEIHSDLKEASLASLYSLPAAKVVEMMRRTGIIDGSNRLTENFR